MRRIICTVIVQLIWTTLLSAASYDAALGSKIDTYLMGKGSPIVNNGNVFFTNGVKYNVDPRLIVAISGAESSFGTVWAACPSTGFNAWSWFYNGNCANSPFSSFAEGIQTVSHFMRKSYLNKGFTTIEQIGSKYCAEGCSGWVPNAKRSYTEQNGDANDLTFTPPTVFTNLSLRITPTGVIPALHMACSVHDVTLYITGSDSGVFRSSYTVGVLQRAVCHGGVAQFASFDLNALLVNSAGAYPAWLSFYRNDFVLVVKDTSSNLHGSGITCDDTSCPLLNLSGSWNSYNQIVYDWKDTTLPTIAAGPMVSFNGAVWSNVANGDGSVNR